jgi:hypothetical protein
MLKVIERFFAALTRNRAYRPKRPHLVRQVVRTEEVAVHRRGGQRVEVPLKRLIVIDQSRYPGPALRALEKERGVSRTKPSTVPEAAR